MLVTGGAGVGVGAPLVARLPEDSTVCLTHESRPDRAARTVTVDSSSRGWAWRWVNTVPWPVRSRSWCTLPGDAV